MESNQVSDLLKEYLLRPARLPDIFTLEQFRAMFPRSVRSSPHIKTLYRDLQEQRNAVVDIVEAQIDAHVQEGERIIQEMRQQRKEAEQQRAAGDDVEMDIERGMFGTEALGLQRPPQHTLETIVPAMKDAVAALEAEIALLEQEEKQLIQETQAEISNLSDLRYGKFENSNLGGEALESLETFLATCEKNS